MLREHETDTRACHGREIPHLRDLRPKEFKKGTFYHPTQKPVSLVEYLIRTYTDEGDVVLDNCIGSGTTAVAAIRCGRHYIGFETDKGYYDIALRRTEEEREKMNNHLETNLQQQ